MKIYQSTFYFCPWVLLEKTFFLESNKIKVEISNHPIKSWYFIFIIFSLENDALYNYFLLFGKKNRKPRSHIFFKHIFSFVFVFLFSLFFSLLFVCSTISQFCRIFNSNFNYVLFLSVFLRRNSDYIDLPSAYSLFYASFVSHHFFFFTERLYNFDYKEIT